MSVSNSLTVAVVGNLSAPMMMASVHICMPIGDIYFDLSIVFVFFAMLPRTSQRYPYRFSTDTTGFFTGEEQYRVCDF